MPALYPSRSLLTSPSPPGYCRRSSNPPQAHDGLLILHEPFFVVVAGEGNHVLLCRMSVSAPSRQTDVGVGC